MGLSANRDEFDNEKTCKLMYINCCKRVNTRIFDEQTGSSNKYRSPAPGTVIDSIVTDRDVHEFYLVSVSARQGMPTPTRFTILYDELAAPPDQI